MRQNTIMNMLKMMNFLLALKVKNLYWSFSTCWVNEFSIRTEQNLRNCIYSEFKKRENSIFSHSWTCLKWWISCLVERSKILIHSSREPETRNLLSKRMSKVVISSKWASLKWWTSSWVLASKIFIDLS